VPDPEEPDEVEPDEVVPEDVEDPDEVVPDDVVVTCAVWFVVPMTGSPPAAIWT
jgi:hypothetical protein